MKDKLSGAMKKFSGAIVQPIMFMAVTGIILSAGVILRMDNMPALLKGMGDFLYNLMMNGGINQLSVIFCVGITVALAKRKKTDAAVVSLSMFYSLFTQITHGLQATICLLRQAHLD